MNDAAIQDYIAPEDLRIFRDDSNNLSVEIKGHRTWNKVVARLAFPYSDPSHFVILMRDDEEIGVVRDVSELEQGSRALLEEALAKRYHIPEILRVLDITESNSAAIWVVETDRGPREFMVRDRHNFRRFRGGDLIIVDVDGNRFRIARDRVFDADSQRLMDNHG